MKKKNAVGLILEMWKRTFDYKGTSGLREFWVPFWIQVVVLFILMVVTGIGITLKVNNVAYWVASCILGVYVLISVIPGISLTVRRLHDAGKSGWWYCLVLAFGVGTVMLLMMCATASTAYLLIQNSTINSNPIIEFFPEYNETPGVYGPPEMMISDEPSEEEFVEESENNGSEVDNEKGSLVEGKSEDSLVQDGSKENLSEEDITFDPDDNLNVAMYGPPERNLEIGQ